MQLAVADTFVAVGGEGRALGYVSSSKQLFNI